MEIDSFSFTVTKDGLTVEKAVELLYDVLKLSKVGMIELEVKKITTSAKIQFSITVDADVVGIKDNRELFVKWVAESIDKEIISKIVRAEDIK